MEASVQRMKWVIPRICIQRGRVMAEVGSEK
jgi:hypothetical protein